MGTMITCIVFGVLFSGPCIAAYLVGRRVGWNDCVRAYNATRQNNRIDWDFRVPPES